jgi:protein-tyrosine phosphatase
MVCMGNICRSPMAEKVTVALLEREGLASLHSVESFATTSYHVGEDVDPQARAALERAGWPVGDHRARQLQAWDLPHFDLVLCADRSNLAHVKKLAEAVPDIDARLLRSFDRPAAGEDDGVPDPWGRSDGHFDHTLAVVERSCRGLVAYLSSS